MGLVKVASRWISSGFGSGFAAIVPGTFGSAAALIFWLMLHGWGSFDSWQYAVALAVITCIVGLLVVSIVLEKNEKESDPQWIVIDEWAGLFISLAGIGVVDVGSVLVAFGLFRLFDGLKWGPVAWAERLPGASGIMADDIVAGIEVVFVLSIVRMLGIL
jgi:phosphatidylglycerophosphatase A